MGKCVNCGKSGVGQPNEDGFAKCRNCGCTNIIPRAQDYAAARKVQMLISSGKLKAQPNDQ